MLDRLCLSGVVGWGRLNAPTEKLMNLTSVAPIGLFPRDDVAWLLSREIATPPLGSLAQNLYRYLIERGASFFTDLVRGTGHLPAEVEQGLWELVSAGLVTADGFDSLRALIDPRRRRAEGRERGRRPRHSMGRWALFKPESFGIEQLQAGSPEFVERVAMQLLHRYGVVFRDLLARESCAPPWRDLLVQYRRLELRGEIRGGRFVAGFTGEQFGLPEAIEALRSVRRESDDATQEVTVSASDPLNLAGIVTPGQRVSAGAGTPIIFRGGVAIPTEAKAERILGGSAQGFPYG
jgi:ATP-dependent Lhr-like helicase